MDTHPAAPLEDAGRALSSVLGRVPVWSGVCGWAAGEADRSPSSQTPSTTVGKSAHLLELSFLMCKLKKGQKPGILAGSMIQDRQDFHEWGYLNFLQRRPRAFIRFSKEWVAQEELVTIGNRKLLSKKTFYMGNFKFTREDKYSLDFNNWNDLLSPFQSIGISLYGGTTL